MLAGKNFIRRLTLQTLQTVTIRMTIETQADTEGTIAVVAMSLTYGYHSAADAAFCLC